jgi:hypothetical protein
MGIFKIFKKKKPVTYRYEQQAKLQDGTPIFNWVGEDGKWVEDDFRGKNLPKNAKREYSESAYEFQKKQIEAGNKNPNIQENKPSIKKMTIKKKKKTEYTETK